MNSTNNLPTMLAHNNVPFFLALPNEIGTDIGVLNSQVRSTSQTRRFKLQPRVPSKSRPGQRRIQRLDNAVTSTWEASKECTPKHPQRTQGNIVENVDNATVRCAPITPRTPTNEIITWEQKVMRVTDNKDKEFKFEPKTFTKTFARRVTVYEDDMDTENTIGNNERLMANAVSSSKRTNSSDCPRTPFELLCSAENLQVPKLASRPQKKRFVDMKVCDDLMIPALEPLEPSTSARGLFLKPRLGARSTMN